MSTDEVYGSTEQIVDVNLLNPANPYSASKAAADMIVTAYKTMHPEITITTLAQTISPALPIYQQYHPTLFSSWFIEKEIYAAW